MNASQLVCCFSLLGITAFAADPIKTVFPEESKNVPGVGNFYVFQSEVEMQQSFRQSFTTKVWDTPVLITDIAFRVEDWVTDYDASIPSVELRLSTTPLSVDQLTYNWDSNKGPDATTVFPAQGIGLHGAGGTGANPFDLKFHLSVPFVYNPQAGDLLMFLSTRDNFGNLQDGFGPNAQEVDAMGYYSNPAASPFYSILSPIDERRPTPRPWGLVTEFTVTPIPEASSGALMILGLGALLLKRRQK